MGEGGTLRGAPLVVARLELGRLHQHLQHLLVAHRDVAVGELLRVHRTEVVPLLRRRGGGRARLEAARRRGGAAARRRGGAARALQQVSERPVTAPTKDEKRTETNPMMTAPVLQFVVPMNRAAMSAFIETAESESERERR